MGKARPTRIAAVVVAYGYLAFAYSQAGDPRERLATPATSPVEAMRADAGAERAGGLSESPKPATPAGAVHVAFVAPTLDTGLPPGDLRVEIYEIGGRRIDLVPAAYVKAEHESITVTWSGRGEGGRAASPKVYVVCAVAPSIGFRSERRLVVR